MLILRATMQLTRLYSSILGFFSIFVPFLVRTKELNTSLGRAIPLLFICMCTFIANDLDDLERDKVNHPERPLPAGHLTPPLATILYFTCLGLALFAIRQFVETGIAFCYYGLVTLSISYRFVVEFLPGLKAPYVAVVISIPVLIVAASFPAETNLLVVAATAFLLSIGREICMDIEDRPGDRLSFVHNFKPQRLAIGAFVLQATGLLLLVAQARRWEGVVCLLGMMTLLALAGVYWFKFANYRRATFLMKMPLFLGLYFLM